MKSVEETHHALQHFGEQVRALVDEHTDAVAYTAQKHILEHMLAHAAKHWGKVVHWSEASEAEGKAWEHERQYINNCLRDLDEQFNVTASEDPMIAALKEVFGPNVRIISTEELMNSSEFAVPTQETTDAVVADTPFPQINKFDNFQPTHRHCKGGLYRKLGDASVEATMAHVVVYCNARGETFTRPINEFMERFEEIN